MELREITILVRVGLWGYLVAATEKTIAANGFSDENQLEVYPLVLLIVPFGVVWSISYRNLTKFRGFHNSNLVHKTIMYSAGSLLLYAIVAAALLLIGPLTEFGLYISVLIPFIVGITLLAFTVR